jgi:hypothetical protein
MRRVLTRNVASVREALSGGLESDYSSEGFTITPEQVYEHAKSSMSAASSWASLGAVISAAKSLPELRWASPLEVKNAVEKVFTETFGPKGTTSKAPKIKVSICLIIRLSG